MRRLYLQRITNKSGGWPWASTNGRALYAAAKYQTAYDWNELLGTKPVHNLALIDRMRSYHPTHLTWSIVDDFRLHKGREARQREYALVLTRGLRGIGTNFLAHNALTDGQQKVDEYRELFQHIHKFAGVYANTVPTATIGILYVHEQAISRPIDMGLENFRGSHEGKVTEALFVCHAAGFPARVITPDELRRGPLPESIKALLLVGLNRFDDTWVWHEGLTEALRNFKGLILTDDESVSPVPARDSGMKLRAFIKQDYTDALIRLFERNWENIAALRNVLSNVSVPIVRSDESTVWALPSRVGDVDYVTVLNFGYGPDQNPSAVVRPQTAMLSWSTTRPIYDMNSFSGRPATRVNDRSRRECDLTSAGFRWYALPPAEPEAPVLTQHGNHLDVSVGGMRGVPVVVAVSGDTPVTLSGASGFPIRLPAGVAGRAVATELLHQQTSVAVRVVAAEPAANPLPSAIGAFLARGQTPAVVALTPEQQQDASFVAAADALIATLRQKGRQQVRRGLLDPSDVVLGQQPNKSEMRYPQWRSIAADLVLLGNPQTNILMFDQARAGLLGAGDINVSYSAFEPKFQVLNIHARSPQDVRKAAAALQQIDRDSHETQGPKERE